MTRDTLLVFKQESIVAPAAAISIHAYTSSILTAFLHIHRYYHPEYQRFLWVMLKIH
jgi:hypothetical protein